MPRTALMTTIMTLAMLLSGIVSAEPAKPSGATTSATPPQVRRPNIIYIMADDLGYGDLGCYGQKRIDTPNIDGMAAEGMKFNDHYSGHTVCRPSRLVLRTGLHSGHTPIHGNSDYVLPKRARITAKLLKQGGYTVGGVGKWALGNPTTPGAPTKQGFDLWYGYLGQGAAHNYYPEVLWRNGEKIKLRNEVKITHNYGSKRYNRSGYATKRVDYSHDLMVDEAMQFIREHDAGPFFLQMHLTIPHANNQGKPHGMEVPDLGRYAKKDWPAPEKGFAAMVSRLDRDVGRVLDLLKARDIDQNTIVFFTSDNGPHSEGGHQDQYFDSNGPLRGNKRDLYEGGIRVPMIVRWPGHIEAGSVSDHVSGFQDFMPTVCDLIGVETPDHIDGVSYLPTLLGRAEKQVKHDHLFWAFRGKRALRSGKWKLVRPGGNKPVELYNLNEDIAEHRDLADEMPQRAKRLQATMQQAFDPAPVPRMR